MADKTVRNPSTLFVVTLSALMTIGVLRWNAINRAASAPHPQQEPTPVIDPLPVLRPAYLPLAARRHDPRVPEPLSSTVRGYVAELRALGRERCAPATHVLLDKPEGSQGAAAIGVLHSRRPGPNLDLYTGEFVEIGGLTGLAPEPCRILTEWLLEVTSIKVIELPPGAPAGGDAGAPGATP